METVGDKVADSPFEEKLADALIGGLIALESNIQREEAEMSQEVRRMIFGACIVAIAGLWYFSMKEKPVSGTGANTSGIHTPNTGGSAGSTKQ